MPSEPTPRIPEAKAEELAKQRWEKEFPRDAWSDASGEWRARRVEIASRDLEEAAPLLCTGLEEERDKLSGEIEAAEERDRRFEQLEAELTREREKAEQELEQVRAQVGKSLSREPGDREADLRLQQVFNFCAGSAAEYEAGTPEHTAYKNVRTFVARLLPTAPGNSGGVEEEKDEAKNCPDGGACHHECGETQCWRVHHCAPLSDYGENWCQRDREQYEDPEEAAASTQPPSPQATRHQFVLVSEEDPDETEVCGQCGAQRNKHGKLADRAFITGGWPSAIDCDLAAAVADPGKAAEDLPLEERAAYEDAQRSVLEARGFTPPPSSPQAEVQDCNQQKEKEMSDESGRCQNKGCTEAADFEITDPSETDIYSSTVNACTAHVGELLGHNEPVAEGAEDRWEVRAL